MTSAYKPSGLALLISFLGSLPVGSLNVTVTNLFISAGMPHACWFALGAAGVEVVTICVAIAAVEGLGRLQRFVRLFQVVSLLVLLALAWLSISAAIQQEAVAAVPLAGQHPFLAGVLLSALNPLHIPFWMGSAALLKTRGLFTPTRLAAICFATAAGVGTLLAFVAYAWGGALLLNFLDGRQYILNGIIGGTLLITAVIHLYKILATASAKPHTR